MTTVIDFPGNTRVHIALAVSDLEKSREFYQTLLGVSPTKERPGYIKFEPTDPSINLTLNEVADTQPTKQQPAHYGIQVKSTDAVLQAINRFQNAGLETSIEENTTCCYAVQDKVWITDPDGHPWEVFVVLNSDATERKSSESTCCTNEGAKTTETACC